MAEGEEEVYFEEDDYVMQDCGVLGENTCVWIGDRMVGEFTSHTKAENAIREDAQIKQDYPNVWFLSDHGNYHFLKDFDYRWILKDKLDFARHPFISEGEVTQLPKEKKIVLQKCFLPFNDPALLRQGVEVCATSIVDTKSFDVINKVQFLKENKEISSIDCIHTKACVQVREDLSLEEKEELGMEPSEERWKIVSTERQPEIKKEISPEDHYIAIKSFVDHIVSTGIQQSIINSMEFNLAVRKGEIKSPNVLIDTQTQQQLLSAISDIDPNLNRELIISSLDFMVGEDPERLELFSEDFTHQICSLSEEDLRRVDEINGGIPHLSLSTQECLVSSRAPLDLELVLRLARSKYRIVKEQIVDQYLVDPNLRATWKDQASVQKLFEILATDSDSDTRSILAQVRKLPENIVSILANDEVPVVRMLLARNQTLDPSVLSRLAKDQNEDVRLAIISSVSQPLIQRYKEPWRVGQPFFLKSKEPWRLEILKGFVDDPDPEVRKTLASIIVFRDDFQVFEEVFNTLANDSDAGVVLRIMDNPATPLDVLLKLATNPDKEIKTLWFQTGIPKEVGLALAVDPDKEIRRELAEYPHLSPAVVNILAKDEDINIRWTVTLRKNLEESTFRILSKDSDFKIRNHISANPRLPEHIVYNLVEDEHWLVRMTIALHRDLPQPELLMLSRDPDERVRKSVVRRQDISDQAALRMSKDPSLEVRVSLVQKYISKSMPEELLEIFLKDEELKKYDKQYGTNTAEILQRQTRLRAMELREERERSERLEGLFGD